jgi:hypothetical protein
MGVHFAPAAGTLLSRCGHMLVAASFLKTLVQYEIHTPEPASLFMSFRKVNPSAFHAHIL